MTIEQIDRPWEHEVLYEIRIPRIELISMLLTKNEQFMVNECGKTNDVVHTLMGLQVIAEAIERCHKPSQNSQTLNPKSALVPENGQPVTSTTKGEQVKSSEALTTGHSQSGTLKKGD